MAIIYDIEWLDRDSGEAIVSIQTGTGLSIDCFAFLFNGEIGEEVNHVLSTLDVKNVVKTDSSQCSAIKICNSFGYYVTAKIADVKNSLIQLDDILIDVGFALYGDAEVGDYIAASISRFDLY